MIRSKSSLQTSSICWWCQCRLSNQRNALTQRALRKDGVAPRKVGSRVQQRALHATGPVSQTALSSSVEPRSDAALLQPSQQKLSIREHLRLWNEKYGGPDEQVLDAFENHPAHGDIRNNIASLAFGSKADEGPGEQEQMLDGEEEGEELITVGLFLKPGDVVELSRPGHEPVLAVFVQQLDLLSQFYSVNGRWCHSRLANISFAVPGAINPTLLQPLLPYLPTKVEGAQPKLGVQVPRDLGAPVRAMLHQLTEDSERIYRTNAAVLDTAYSILADPTHTRIMTLSQIAKILLGKSDPAWSPSPAAMLAVRKALNHNEFRFRSDARSQRITNVFAIRPQNDVELVETVQGWVREYREHEAALANAQYGTQRPRKAGAAYVQSFVRKVQRLVAESRKRRQPNSGFVGPDQTSQSRSGVRGITWGEEFHKTEQQIINFLQAWVLTDQFSSMPNLHSACASILHATGCYGDLNLHNGPPSTQMGRSIGYLLLQEIGVITPFEDRAIYNENLMLPTVGLSRNLQLLSTKAELTRRNPDFRDAMGDMRRDWGSIPVYCVDDSGAKEIDDGFSIERVPGKPASYWIHVHVANPTAFFDKTHVLSGLAAHMTESVYTPERVFAMLPSWASQNYFSLAPNRPAITFSSLIDGSGNVLESKIQHGIIRKVVTLTPTEMATHLDEQIKDETTRLVVGGKPATSKSRPLPQLAAEQVQDLRDLYSAAKSLWKGRQAAGAVRVRTKSRADVSLYEKPDQPRLTWMPPSIEKARRIVGDPIIELRSTSLKLDGFHESDINSSNIVEEMMILACRTAGSWCAERNIPVMFRGTVPSPHFPLSLAQFKEEILQPHLEKNGVMSMSVEAQYYAALGRAIVHSSSLPHNVMGVKSYVKVTSPLRRFGDMIAHWQIEAALRYEARTGQKLNAKTLAGSSRPILSFSLRQLQEAIITLSAREKMIIRTKVASTDFWSVQAFMRAFYYQEAPLPETFTVRVNKPGTSNKEVTIAVLETYSTLVNLMDLPGVTYQLGDRWEVRIKHIDVFRRRIQVEPLQLLSREE